MLPKAYLLILVKHISSNIESQRSTFLDGAKSFSYMKKYFLSVLKKKTLLFAKRDILTLAYTESPF